MGFISVLWAMSLFVVVYCLYWSFKKVGDVNHTSSTLRERFARPRLHFIQADIHELIAKEPQHVYFHLQDEESTDDPEPYVRIGITIRQFEDCLPGVPLDTRIFVACPNGFTAPQLRRIRRLRTNREIFVVKPRPIRVGPAKLVRS